MRDTAVPRGDLDVRLDWDAGNSEVEHSILLQVGMGIPRADLPTLSIWANATLWSAEDWCDTFMGVACSCTFALM